MLQKQGFFSTLFLYRTQVTLYRHHVDQQIAKTRQLGSGSVNTELENRGGTNIVAGSILLVIWLGLVALAISAS